jgi:hypothetical protein
LGTILRADSEGPKNKKEHGEKGDGHYNHGHARPGAATAPGDTSQSMIDALASIGVGAVALMNRLHGGNSRFVGDQV